MIESRTHDAAAPPAGASRMRTGRLSAHTALVFSILALLACGYLGYTFNQKRGIYRADMFSRLDKLESEATEAKTELADVRAHLDGLHTVQDSLVAAMDKLEAAGANRLDAIRIAEAEQLLVIANHRLQLSRDVDLALAALRAADRQLALAARPAFVPVRREIAAAIGALTARAVVDVPGLALKLNDQARNLDRLPLTPGALVTAAASPRTDSAGVTGELLSLLRLRTGTDIAKPLLPPDQAYFLRENLRLTLLGAQLALLNGDTDLFTRNVGFAREWLKTWFDNQNPAVRGLDDDLKAMLAAPLGEPLPDLSKPLDLLKTLAAKRPAP